MLQELSDEELGMVSGAHRANGPCNVNVNLSFTVIENNYSIIYAPLIVYGTLSNSSIYNSNTYIQISTIRHH